ncbi:MAG: rhodanese-like domain-containing protein [Gammaproteobacteria bacterium]|nr:rhodanese-like domain-containing protein [Gammaproteobacteria bacterium]
MPAGELAQEIQRAEAPMILDVRTVKEYRAGHIPGAVNIPIAELARRLAELEPYRARPMVVHCESGPRAWHAARMLYEAGFTEVHELAGHMRAWRGAGYPME